MKRSELRSRQDVLAEDLKDPEFRAEWERTALARLVAHRVLAFRIEHGLSQTELARRLGMKQPAIARLERGENNPSLETLYRLSNKLRLEFVIDIVPEPGDSHVIATSDGATLDERFDTEEGSTVHVLVGSYVASR